MDYFAKIDYKLRKRNRPKAQVIIEFTLAFFCLILFLLATARLFAWFGGSIVRRHRAYQQTRTLAGNGTTTSSQINFYNHSDYPLNIFDNWVPN